MAKNGSGWISGYWNRGYDEGSDGEFYRSGGVLDHRNSISEAPRQGKTCGITDPAGKRREGAEAIKKNRIRVDYGKEYTEDQNKKNQ